MMPKFHVLACTFLHFHLCLSHLYHHDAQTCDDGEENFFPTHEVFQQLGGQLEKDQLYHQTVIGGDIVNDPPIHELYMPGVLVLPEPSSKCVFQNHDELPQSNHQLIKRCHPRNWEFQNSVNNAPPFPGFNVPLLQAAAPMPPNGSPDSVEGPPEPIECCCYCKQRGDMLQVENTLIDPQQPESSAQQLYHNGLLRGRTSDLCGCETGLQENKCDYSCIEILPVAGFISSRNIRKNLQELLQNLRTKMESRISNRMKISSSESKGSDKKFLLPNEQGNLLNPSPSSDVILGSEAYPSRSENLQHSKVNNDVELLEKISNEHLRSGLHDEKIGKGEIRDSQPSTDDLNQFDHSSLQKQEDSFLSSNKLQTFQEHFGDSKEYNLVSVPIQASALKNNALLPIPSDHSRILQKNSETNQNVQLRMMKSKGLATSGKHGLMEEIKNITNNNNNQTIQITMEHVKENIGVPTITVGEMDIHDHSGDIEEDDIHVKKGKNYGMVKNTQDFQLGLSLLNNTMNDDTGTNVHNGTDYFIKENGFTNTTTRLRDTKSEYQELTTFANATEFSSNKFINGSAIKSKNNELKSILLHERSTPGHIYFLDKEETSSHFTEMYPNLSVDSTTVDDKTIMNTESSPIKASIPDGTLMPDETYSKPSPMDDIDIEVIPTSMPTNIPSISEDEPIHQKKSSTPFSKVNVEHIPPLLTQQANFLPELRKLPFSKMNDNQFISDKTTSNPISITDTYEFKTNIKNQDNKNVDPEYSMTNSDQKMEDFFSNFTIKSVSKLPFHTTSEYIPTVIGDLILSRIEKDENLHNKLVYSSDHNKTVHKPQKYDALGASMSVEEKPNPLVVSPDSSEENFDFYDNPEYTNVKDSSEGGSKFENLKKETNYSMQSPYAPVHLTEEISNGPQNLITTNTVIETGISAKKDNFTNDLTTHAEVTKKHSSFEALHSRTSAGTERGPLQKSKWNNHKRTSVQIENPEGETIVGVPNTAEEYVASATEDRILDVGTTQSEEKEYDDSTTVRTDDPYMDHTLKSEGFFNEAHSSYNAKTHTSNELTTDAEVKEKHGYSLTSSKPLEEIVSYNQAVESYVKDPNASNLPSTLLAYDHSLDSTTLSSNKLTEFLHRYDSSPPSEGDVMRSGGFQEQLGKKMNNQDFEGIPKGTEQPYTMTTDGQDNDGVKTPEDYQVTIAPSQSQFLSEADLLFPGRGGWNAGKHVNGSKHSIVRENASDVTVPTNGKPEVKENKSQPFLPTSMKKQQQKFQQPPVELVAADERSPKLVNMPAFGAKLLSTLNGNNVDFKNSSSGATGEENGSFPEYLTEQKLESNNNTVLLFGAPITEPYSSKNFQNAETLGLDVSSEPNVASVERDNRIVSSSKYYDIKKFENNENPQRGSFNDSSPHMGTKMTDEEFTTTLLGQSELQNMAENSNGFAKKLAENTDSSTHPLNVNIEDSWKKYKSENLISSLSKILDNYQSEAEEKRWGGECKCSSPDHVCEEYVNERLKVIISIIEWLKNQM